MYYITSSFPSICYLIQNIAPAVLKDSIGRPLFSELGTMIKDSLIRDYVNQGGRGGCPHISKSGVREVWIRIRMSELGL